MVGKARSKLVGGRKFQRTETLLKQVLCTLDFTLFLANLKKVDELNNL